MRTGAVFATTAIALVSGLVIGQPQIERWQEARIDSCEQRAARLSQLDLLDRWPSTLQPVSPTAGCDSSDGIAPYAARRFNGIPDPGGVTAYYRTAVEQDGWTVAVGIPSTALLCASRDVDGTTAYLTVSAGTDSSVDLYISDETQSGSQRCA
ncbi:hypothetical protein [Actinoplanes sp. NPDC051859]|uniref:hypothetical protein n=1 Tax=Actinoplanes sp. NPDC051859 TaxID=3363909 RepID=UPI0037B96C61